MLIFHKEVSLAEGFTILKKEKKDRLVGGKQVSACSGWSLFATLEPGPIRCWSCGCYADRWVADKGQNDKLGPPVLNLYGIRRGKLVLMNRDHIIPRSLGGTDAIENLRPACEVCNGRRGNAITKEDLKFRDENPHLFSQTRFETGKKKALKHAAKHKNNIEGERSLENYNKMAAHLAVVAPPHDNSIRSQIAPTVAPPIANKETQTPDVIQSLVDWILLDDIELVKQVISHSGNMRWINTDKGFVGPYIRKELYEHLTGRSSLR